MTQGASNTFRYESSRHKTLMEEYAKLSSLEEYSEWGKKAPLVAAYMNQSLVKVASFIKMQKARFEQEQDEPKKQGMKMSLMELMNFHQIVQKQLDSLIQVMEKLPSGSVRADYETLIKPWSPTADTPYVKIRVSRSGEVALNGALTNLESVQDALEKLAQIGGLVLYSRELAEDSEEVPAVAEQIIRLVANNRLPIRLCEKEDFSEAIDEIGKLRVSQ